ncbi:GNAT family N-acetyltransferase [Deinococcus alpinitundrae]|uniref:GNAT family N-acetyltransferase n=1 Tax=Deinococcus alpinitundrae TaxID=468913 RepID=UPI00137A08B9|nr:GNAT family N-acetyltransferase [Deinococcus alpinitundrae]
MNSVTIRPYVTRDRSACLAVFDSNVPTFFLPNEREQFAADLDDFETDKWGIACYLVLEEASETIACGGAYVQPDGHAGLAWGMVRRNKHRHGLGSCLLSARLDWLRTQSTAHEVWLDTTQHSAPFFQRFGFQVMRETPDAIGPGMNRLDLKLDLSVQT